jgi:hypothetical protein
MKCSDTVQWTETFHCLNFQQTTVVYKLRVESATAVVSENMASMKKPKDGIEWAGVCVVSYSAEMNAFVVPVFLGEQGMWELPCGERNVTFHEKPADCARDGLYVTTCGLIRCPRKVFLEQADHGFQLKSKSECGTWFFVRVDVSTAQKKSISKKKFDKNRESFLRLYSEKKLEKSFLKITEMHYIKLDELEKAALQKDSKIPSITGKRRILKQADDVLTEENLAVMRRLCHERYIRNVREKYSPTFSVVQNGGKESKKVQFQSVKTVEIGCLANPNYIDTRRHYWFLMMCAAVLVCFFCWVISEQSWKNLREAIKTQWQKKDNYF